MIMVIKGTHVLTTWLASTQSDENFTETRDVLSGGFELGLRGAEIRYVGSNKFCTLRQALTPGWSPVKTMNFHAPDECSILSSLR